MRVELDCLSMADRDSLEGVKVVDKTKGAILSGAGRMSPVEEAGTDEDCGLGVGLPEIPKTGHLYL